ncbi:MAG: glycosyltransferase family 39 protein [Bacteroidales bacterium]|nr:glycosyltransferase family 39 protein [Bacteroidales bacterium]
MTIKEKHIPKALIILLIISIVIRSFLAGFHEFGNDEVYYWTYALYPDWSHFDHPGMVGWMMQLFSLNLLFDNEFALRLSSVVLMTVDTWLIYLIGTQLKDKITGFFAALLYTSSLYAFVITGVFIMPDTPLMFFTLLSIYLFIRYFKKRTEQPIETHNRASLQYNVSLLFAGLFAGLAMLSKYSAASIWAGVGLYILFFNRKELRNKYLYLSILISALCLLPILIWNMQNNFISFTFHGDRVSLFGKPRFDYLGIEFAGELLYNNPIVYILIIIALIAFFRKKFKIEKTGSRLLLLTALPWIGTFIYFSFTRSTFPHWSAPGVCLLIPIAGAYLAAKQENMTGIYRIPSVIIAALLLLTVVVGVGTFEIKTGRIQACLASDKSVEMSSVGKGDVTLDMYGWDQMKDGFATIRDSLVATGEMQADDGIIALKWFPAANMDYYIATPLGMNLYALGDLNQIHKYFWINQYRGGLQEGRNYWFINQSYNYYEPDGWYLQPYFKHVIPIDTFAIYRSGRVAEYVFVYKLEGYQCAN